jgi:hypothetical protein
MNGSRGNDALSGDDGANGFAGNDGDDVINGRGGDDFINGGAGHDTIEDFHQGDADVIRFTGVFADYNDIIGHASDNSAGNVVIATDTGDSVELLGVDLAHLSSSDFIV